MGINLVFYLCIISLNRSEQLRKLSLSLMHRQLGQKELIGLAVTENVGLFPPTTSGRATAAPELAGCQKQQKKWLP